MTALESVDSYEPAKSKNLKTAINVFQKILAVENNTKKVVSMTPDDASV